MRSGVFENIEAAVMAAKGAYKRFSSFSLRERGEMINGLRIELLKHAEELAAMEKEETRMGVYKDKLTQITKAIIKTPGSSLIETNASTDEEGLFLNESFPYGVTSAAHPLNHPVASIINNTIMLLAAGNSVINLVPKRAENVCQYTVEIMNMYISLICGIDNLVICMQDNRYEYNLQIMEHPDVTLCVVTGGIDIVNRALSAKKRIIAAGNSNPVTIIDEGADFRNAARNVIESVSFDNNLLCTSEKTAVVLDGGYETFKGDLIKQGAYYLNQEEVLKLKAAVFDIDENVKKEIIGQDPSVVLIKAGIIKQYDESIKIIAFDSDISDAFVTKEVATPILPIVKTKYFEDAVEIAKFIEQGLNHTAGIFSKNIDHLSYASRQLQTSVFIKNGSSLNAAGIKGNGPVTFTIANVTGEGAVTPKDFVKNRKCLLMGAFERR